MQPCDSHFTWAVADLGSDPHSSEWGSDPNSADHTNAHPALVQSFTSH